MTVFIKLEDKDPDSRVDYGFDWSDWMQTLDTIVGSSWTLPSGLTTDENSYTDDTTVVWLLGGITDTLYDVSNEITTSDGRIENKTFTIYCKEK